MHNTVGKHLLVFIDAAAREYTADIFVLAHHFSQKVTLGIEKENAHCCVYGVFIDILKQDIKQAIIFISSI